MNSKSIPLRRMTSDVSRWLQEKLPHGTTVYTIVRHVRRDKIGGVVSLLIIADARIVNMSSAVSDVLDVKWDDRDGVWTNSDFDLVQRLSYFLHGYKNRGRQPKGCHRLATPQSFKAGYALEHVRL